MDSSVVGYDGGQNVRDEERSVGQKKLVRKAEPPSKRGIAWPRWTGFRGMTVRDWLDLLVVPLALVVIGFLFSVQQDARQQRIEDQRDQQAQKIENRRAEAERAIQQQNAQDEALQAYLDQMSNLLLEKDLRNADEDSEVRTLARARTLTVLGRLDSGRKEKLLQFLYEAELLQKSNPVIALDGADLRGINLSGNGLSGGPFLGSLQESFEHAGARPLKGALESDSALVSSPADMSGASLGDADLTYAWLAGVDLSGAELGGADLRYASLDNANLSYARLDNANLSDASLEGANLRRAALFKANLSGAEGVTNEQLEQQALAPLGATMPNGQKYEDWLKDKKAQGKDEQNE